MNMKSNNKYIINPEFEHLFAHANLENRLEEDAQMFSFKVLSEVQKICDDQKISRKELAKMVNTSASFITQLFTGTKQISPSMIARFQHGLKFELEVKAKCYEESYGDFVGKIAEHHHLLGQLFHSNNYSFLCSKRPDYNQKSNLTRLNPNQPKIQTA